MKLIIIGGGPGGYETAAEALSRGLEVTLITDGPLGGTCLNEGCIPTKTLCRFAEGLTGERLLDASEMESFQGVKAGVVQQLQGGIAGLLRKAEVVYGKARFTGSKTVAVGETEYKADRIIIATGSVAASLPIPGAELCLGSREMLSLPQVPGRLCVIGGGVIGLEFAGIYRAFGSEVTVLEYCPGILPRFDEDLAKRLRLSLKKRGIAIETSAQVTEVSKSDGGLSVKYILKDEEHSVEADVALMAVGRRANTEGLGLEAAGIACGRRGIEVDSNMRTNIPGIYAIGDVTGGIMLAHYASFQGRRALNDILGETDNIRFDICPAAVFTVPEVAAVGLTEEDCKARGIDFKAHKAMYGGNGKAVSMGATEGYVKVLTEGEEGRILGVHIMGAHASDIIHEAAALMHFDANLLQARDIIHAHPSLSEVLQAALRS
ncbi:MAG: dihydrolipoyl dehydrogenase [Bacteroidales bacterium]|nr:dihydrolipoyl dehydrogenase [Bacteroidales bacterium]